MVRHLLDLLEWRTAHGDLFDGEFELLDGPPNELGLRWTTGQQRLEARVDVAARTYRIEMNGVEISIGREPSGRPRS